MAKAAEQEQRAAAGGSGEYFNFQQRSPFTQYISNHVVQEVCRHQWRRNNKNVQLQEVRVAAVNIFSFQQHLYKMIMK